MHHAQITNPISEIHLEVHCVYVNKHVFENQMAYHLHKESHPVFYGCDFSKF